MRCIERKEIPVALVIARPVQRLVSLGGSWRISRRRVDDRRRQRSRLGLRGPVPQQAGDTLLREPLAPATDGGPRETRPASDRRGAVAIRYETTAGPFLGVLCTAATGDSLKVSRSSQTLDSSFSLFHRASSPLDRPSQTVKKVRSRPDASCLP